LLRLYAIGIATAIGIAGSWYTAHRYIRFEWPPGTAMARELLRDVPARRAAGTLQGDLDRIHRTAGVKISIYDLDDRLVASNIQPAFPAPTPDEQRRALVKGYKTHLGQVVIDVRQGDALVGYCVLDREFPPPPPWGVVMDLLIISTWISAVGYLMWRTLVRPLQKIATAAEAFGAGNMAARTGVERDDEIGKVALAFDDMSERIARSREAERELMAGLSHELRTPMARIRVALDLAAESDAETARASLADVAEDLTELETLLKNIFSTTRLELAAAARGDQPVPLQRAEVELAALVEKAVGHQRTQHPQRPYVLRVAEAAAGRCIYADAVLVRRAIENVLENAHKYSPGDSPVTITITIAEETKGFRVAIADRGFGIGADDLPRVFSPFFRADRSRTRTTGGVGLGLALAKRVVEAHGGSVGITSQIDAGTTVTFVLPPAQAPRRTADTMRNIS
jgi:two-component system, OmpR family, sensor kinase